MRSLAIGSVIAGALILATPVAAEPLIAVVGGMSGQFTSIGRDFRNGVNAAVERINAAGGVLGEPITVVTRDDFCSPESAVEVARDLAGEGVDLVVGHLCSGASIAASDVYAAAGIVQITPSSTAPDFTDRDLWNVFRTCGRDDMQGFVLADHLDRYYPTAQVALVHDDSHYSAGLMAEIERFTAANGTNVVFRGDFPRLEDGAPPSVAEIVQGILTSGADVAVVPSYAQEVSAILSELRDSGSATQIVGGDTLMNDDFINIAGPLLEGVEISFPPDPSDDFRNAELTAELEAQGISPEAFTFYNYAAVEIWAQAVENAGTLDGSAVADALRNGEFTSVLGEVSFDEKGDISSPGFVMYRFIEGEADYL